MSDELSPFERHVQERLGRKNRAWPADFDRCLKEARPVLAELRRKGGDDGFALFVLANYRWRRVVPPGPRKERDALITQIDQLLGNQGVWYRRLRHSASWAVAAEELRRGLDRVLSSRPHDTSAFESTQTDSRTESPRWASDHSYTCLWVLDWYLRQVDGVRRIRRRLLGDLLLPFGFLGDSTDPDLLIAKRLHRNPRVRKGHRFIRNFTLAHLMRMYHHEHSAAGVACASLCENWPDVLVFTPPAEADRLTEEARGLERRAKHARAAERYRAALHEVEKVLGKDHGYVACILVRYWLALRHARQHAKAERIKGRAEAMWAKYGQGILSD